MKDDILILENGKKYHRGDIYRRELSGLPEAYALVLQRMTDAENQLKMDRRNAIMSSYSSPQ